jgi:hypothetical protein
MADQQWRTLREIEAITGDGHASISARLRTYAADEYLKQVFTKERRRREDAKRGIFEYRILRRIGHLDNPERPFTIRTSPTTGA